MIIAVIGGDPAPEHALEQAEAVGREIAQLGHTLICGGRGGVMEAACRGASEAGGLTIGVLPGNNRREMNAYVQLPIVTGIGHARQTDPIFRTDDPATAMTWAVEAVEVSSRFPSQEHTALPLTEVGERD
jgi:uncharacterized protein (TIGR00725 family)